MKKAALILLCGLFLSALYGCGGSSSAPDTAPAGESSAAAGKPAESSGEDSIASGPKYEACVKKGNVYESEMLNLKFTLPEGWVFLTDEEILELNQKFGYQTIEEMVSTDKMIMDMAAWKDGSYPRMTVQFSNNSSNGLDKEYTTQEIAEKSRESQAERHTTGPVKSFTLDDGTEYYYFTAQEDMNDDSGRTFYNTNVMRSLGRYTLLIQYSGFENDFETAILPQFASITETPQNNS